MESLVSTRVDPRASDAGHHVGQKEGASTWTAVGKGPLRTVQDPGPGLLLLSQGDCLNISFCLVLAIGLFTTVSRT